MGKKAIILLPSLQSEKVIELQSQLERLNTQSADVDVSCRTSFTKCIYDRRYFISQCFNSLSSYLVVVFDCRP